MHNVISKNDRFDWTEVQGTHKTECMVGAFLFSAYASDGGWFVSCYDTSNNNVRVASKVGITIGSATAKCILEVNAYIKVERKCTAADRIAENQRHFSAVRRARIKSERSGRVE